MIFILLILTSLSTCYGLDQSFKQWHHAPNRYCGNNSCIYVNCSEVCLTLNNPKNISFQYTSNKHIEFLNLYYDSSFQLEQLPNRSHISIFNDTESFIIELEPIQPGHTVLHIYAAPINNLTRITEGFVRVNVRKSLYLYYFGEIIGWIYFLSWSISFYPQIILNFKRKSVVGLHFDFLSLNIIGFFFYTIFNIALFWIPSVQEEYFYKHPYGINPVQINDVIFSIHAFLVCLFLVFQCFIYDRGEQVISKATYTFFWLLSIGTILFLVLASTNAITWLEYIYLLSYVKLFITLIKCIPQAYYNHVRRSTAGWSIGNILLDFTGGMLSIFQMFILSYNFNDWGSIFGDFTKFGLGLFSILFDILFIMQHYVWYKGFNAYEEILQNSVEEDASVLVGSDNTYSSATVEGN